MTDVHYKEYSPEESAVYEAAIARIREGLQGGLSFDEACREAEIKDSGLRVFIEDDALKILLAELHFGGAMPVQDFAERVRLPLKRINKAIVEMLEDAGVTAAEMYQQDSEQGPVGRA
ncbi:MAG TPA: hypothetical protein VLH56_13040 [Dissulfurispiraceae bacterium]|nr:hypothetical protein [Dissulfurispiraceae bacterium]